MSNTRKNAIPKIKIEGKALNKSLEGGSILVPVDGSQTSSLALSYASNLAKRYSAEVRIVYVTPSPVFIFFQDTFEELTIVDIEERLERSGQDLLDRFSGEAEAHGIKATTTLLRGHPGRQIVQYAKAQGFDLIVMASSGLSAVSRFLLGSVSSYVVNHAECPVIIVK